MPPGNRFVSSMVRGGFRMIGIPADLPDSMTAKKRIRAVGPLTVAIVIAACVSCGGDTVFAGGCSSYPMQIVLPGEPGLDALTLRVTLEVGAAEDLLLVIRDFQGCGVPPGNRFVWTTLDPTVAGVYATGDSTARVRAVVRGRDGGTGEGRTGHDVPSRARCDRRAVAAGGGETPPLAVTRSIGHALHGCASNMCFGGDYCGDSRLQRSVRATPVKGDAYGYR